MELEELDLEGIEKACDNLKTGYIPFNQLVLFKEALIKTKGSRGLGVVSDSMKGGERKTKREEDKFLENPGRRREAVGVRAIPNDRGGISISQPK